MKPLLAILLLTLPLSSAEVRLAWDYPDPLDDTNLWWCIYSHTNITAPRSNWFVTVLPATGTTARAVMIPERRFFFVTASNSFWREESEPSNTVVTPKPATNVTNITITKP